ncbi:ATP synthase subunit I [Rhodoblastus sp.]|uniref:ATP synthase subunit I n=1 Tax=Rhodoblastus sp. TaxID=1962975 RepID=UPI002627CA11|nr:ATP synthase subunit I [Rhodoblastus sp.]
MSFDPSRLSEGLRLIAFFAAGIGAGALYFLAVWRNAQALAQAAGTGRTILAMAGRFALMALALGLASRGGAGALLATAGGVLLARFFVVRRLKERTP